MLLLAFVALAYIYIYIYIFFYIYIYIFVSDKNLIFQCPSNLGFHQQQIIPLYIYIYIYMYIIKLFATNNMGKTYVLQMIRWLVQLGVECGF
jgi:hypothetical protein